MCGIDNCINILPSDNFPSTHDCCFAPIKCGGSQMEPPHMDTASCCTFASPCGINEGDCDNNFECQGELMCGIDNCINILPLDNFPSTHDCCFDPQCNGNQDITWHCCSSSGYVFCGENEGDCDDDWDCVGNLLCGNNNCLNIDVLDNFTSNHDCCYIPLTSKCSLFFT